MHRPSNLSPYQGTHQPRVLHNTANRERFPLWPPFIDAQQRHGGTADTQLDKLYINLLHLLFIIFSIIINCTDTLEEYRRRIMLYHP